MPMIRHLPGNHPATAVPGTSHDGAAGLPGRHGDDSAGRARGAAEGPAKPETVPLQLVRAERLVPCGQNKMRIGSNIVGTGPLSRGIANPPRK